MDHKMTTQITKFNILKLLLRTNLSILKLFENIGIQQMNKYPIKQRRGIKRKWDEI